MMIATAIGAANATEGQPYVLNLSQDLQPSPTATWQIDWGDGAVQTIAATSPVVSHVYADGPTTPTINASVFAPDGKFAGFSPTEISVGSDGSVFARKSDDSLHQLSGLNWNQIPGSYRKISVRTATEIWWLDAVGNVSIWNGATNTPVPGRLLKNISVASDGTTWGIDTANVIVTRSGSNWVSVTGGLVDIEARVGGGAVGANSAGTVYSRSGSTWSPLPGSFKDVSVGADGTLIGLNAAGDVFRYSVTAWQPLSWPKLTQISVRNTSEIWGIDTTGAVVRWDGASLRRIPLAASSFAVNNSAPVGVFGAAPSLYINEPYVPPVRFNDNGIESVQHVAINWGDGSPIEIAPASDLPSHRFANPATYSIAITPFDEDSPLPPATANGAGTLVVEARRFQTQTGSGVSVWNRQPSVQGSLSAIELAAAPPTSLGDTTNGARVDYNVDLATAGLKYLWVRLRSPQATSASIHLGLNGVPISYGGQGVATSSSQWEWVRTIAGGPVGNRLSVTSAAGPATVNVWSRAGQIEVDQILLIPDINFTPIGRLHEIRQTTGAYSPVTTTVTVTPGFQSTPAILPGSSLPIAVVDRANILVGQSILIPVTANDFDPDGQAISLVSAWLANWSPDTSNSLSPPVVSIESGAVRVRSSATSGEAAIKYVVEDASGNRATGALLFRLDNFSVPAVPASPFNSGNAVESTASKFVTREETDITIPSAGIPVEVKRNYSSDRTDNQGFGPGWTFNYGTFVNVAVAGNSFVWTRPDGTTETYNAGSTTGGLTAFSNLLGNGTTAQRTIVGSVTTIIITTKYGERYQFGVTGQRGRIEQIRDRNANVQSIVYQAGGMIQQVDESFTGSTGRTRLVFQTTGDRITSVTDDRGRTWNYEYNQSISGNSYLSGALLPAALLGGARQSVSYQYSPLTGSTGLLTNVTERTGDETKFKYYLNGRLETVSTGGIVTARYGYDDATARREMVDGTGVRTIEKFNSKKAVLERYENGSLKVTNQYDAFGRLTNVTAAGQDPILYTYDAKGNILTQKAANGVYSKFDYDPNFSQVTRIISDVSLSTTTDDIILSTRTLDANGNLVDEVDTLLNKTTRVYDSRGQVISITDARGVATPSIAGDFTTEFVYNADGQLTQRRLPMTTAPTGSRPIENLSYDGFYNLLSQTDPTGVTTTFQYDRIGQLLSKMLPAPYPAISTVPIITQIQYDNFGRVIGQTDGRGNQTLFQWDASGRIARQVNPDGSDTRTTYDAAGRPLTIRSETGHVTSYVYDAVGQLKATIFPDGSKRINDGTSVVTEANGGYSTVTQNSKGQTTQSRDVNGGITTWTYNTRGQVASTTDPLGQVTSFAYDALGRLIETRVVNQRVDRTTYDSVGNPIIVTSYDILGLPANPNLTTIAASRVRVTGTTFDASNRPLAITSPDPDDGGPLLPSTQITTYDGAGRPLSVTDARGKVTTFLYDNAGRLHKTTLPATDAGAAVLTSILDANGNETKSVDALGRSTIRVFDALNRPITTTDALGQSSSIAYDRAGSPIVSVDALGRATYRSYDSRGSLVKTVLPDPDLTDAVPAPVWQYQYDTQGLLTQSIDPLGRISNNVYDVGGRLIKSLSPLYDAPADSGYSQLRKATAYTYNVVGGVLTEVTGIENAAGTSVAIAPVASRTTTRTYTAVGRPLRVTSPDPDGAGQLVSAYTQYGYNGFGNVVSTIDQLSRTTAFAYDKLGRKIQTTLPDPDGAGPLAAPITRTVYDETGNVIQTRDANNQLWQYAYDAIGRQTSVTAPDVSVTQTVFDLAGNPIRTIDAKSLATDRTFDALNRVTVLTSPPVVAGGVRPVWQTAYDAVGNVIATTQPTEAGNPAIQTVKLYDRLDRLVVVTSPDPDGPGPLAAPVMRYGYDSANRETSMTDPLLRVTQYSYDSLDRPTIVTLPDLDGNPLTPALTTQTLYYDVSQSRVSVDARGQRTTRWLDSLGRVFQEVQPEATTGLNYTAPINNYAYDNAGNLVRVTDTLLRATTFTYDLLDRKKTQNDPDAGQGVPVTTWSYDAAGNVTSITDPLGRVTTQAFDSRNRRTSITYPRTIAGDPASAATESVAYDVLGNITASTDALGRVTTFGYDNLSRLILQTLPDPDLTDAVPAPTLQFQYDLRGNQIQATDELGRITRTTYDQLSRPIQMMLPIADGAVTTGGPTRSTVYDSAGNVTSQTDLAGRVTQSQYDAWNRPTKTTLPDPDGAGPLPAPFTVSTYDAVGNVIAVTDHTGRREDFLFDNLNRPIGTTLRDPDGNGPASAPTTSQAYDRIGNLVSSTDTLGRTTTYSYNAANRLTVENLPPDTDQLLASSFITTTYTYDRVGNQTTKTDPLGRVTTYAYDARNRRISETLPDPDGAGTLLAPKTESTYDLVGNVISSRDQLGRVTSFQYDRLDRQTTITLPDPDATGPLAAPIMRYVYDAIGNTLETIDPRGNRTAWTYDNWNRKKSEQLPSPSPSVHSPATGPLTLWVYDVMNNVTSQTDPLGRVTVSTYDALDRVLITTFPDPDGVGPLIAPQTINTYNAEGNLATTAERLTASTFLTTTYAYDSWDRKVQSTDPRGAVTRWNYDTQDNLTSVIDPGNNTTTFAYNRRDRLVSTTNGLGLVETYQNDKVGNRTKTTNRNGKVINYGYDALDRVITEQWYDPAGPGTVRMITTSYTNGGKLFAVTDPDSSTIYSYDSLDRVTGFSRTGTGLTAHSFGYAYDVAGNLTTTTQTVGSDVITTANVYDAINRITEISQTGAAVRSLKANYAYSATGEVTSVQRYQSTTINSPATSLVATTDFAFDSLDRQTAITHKLAATTLAGYGLTYDAASRITQINSVADGVTNYTLDGAGQLTSATKTIGANEAFTYDAAGNRIGGGNTVGTNNQLLRDGTYAYTYDGNGNRITRTVLVGGNPTGAQTRYTFDFRNRLTAVREYTAANVLTAATTYTYDGGNNRLTRSVDVDGNGTIDQNQRFILDGDSVTAVTGSTGVIQNRYLHGRMVDEVLADIGVGGNVNWGLADHQNTVRDVASFSGAVTTIANHRTFASFGQMLTQTSAAADWLFGFTGREPDSQTGLNFYRDRWYDPLTGEFTSEDPIGFAGGDTNLSRYVGNSPVDYTDPTGNSWLSSVFRKVKREASRLVGQVRGVLSDAFQDVRDFAQEHPFLAGAAALATGTWFVAASGGIAGAFANLGSLASRAFNSILVNPFAPASSGIGGTYSVSIGSLADFSIGAGISGTSAFAGANVSVLGLPVWGIGPTVGIFGNVADPYASTLAGNLSDSVSRAALGGTGILDVGSFVKSVAVGTARDYGLSQLNQTGLPLALSVASHTTTFASDVYGAFHEVLTPPVPVYVQPPKSAQQAADSSGLQRLPDDIDNYALPLNSTRRGQFDPFVTTADYVYDPNGVGQPNPVSFAFGWGDANPRTYFRAGQLVDGSGVNDMRNIFGDYFFADRFRYTNGTESEAYLALRIGRRANQIDEAIDNLGGNASRDSRVIANGKPTGGGHNGVNARQAYANAVNRSRVRTALMDERAVLEQTFSTYGLDGVSTWYATDYGMEGFKPHGGEGLRGAQMAAGGIGRAIGGLESAESPLDFIAGGLAGGLRVAAMGMGQRQIATTVLRETAEEAIGVPIIAPNSAASRTVFRGERSSRTPELVFEQGLQPKGTNGDLLRHVTSNQPDTGFVSTSIRPGIAKGFAGKNGYTYVIRSKNGVDVNVRLGSKSPFPEQFEVAIPGGVHSSEVMGAFQMSKGEIVGGFLRNPNFRKQ